jgi:hypothetical protein
MAEFLTTTGTSHALEQVIKNSKEKLYLISPYVQLSPLLKGMLNQIDAKSLDLRLVYRDEIKEEDMAFLKSIKGIKLYSLENLHAKCYMNQDTAIVTSMNLFRYSQQNNHEMGIKINKATDPELYSELSKEVEFLIGQSKKYDKIADSVSTVIGFTKKTITAIKGDLSSVEQTVDIYKNPSCAAISPDGKKVYTFCVEWILARDTGDYSLDSFSTYYNVKDMEVVPKGLKFPVGGPILPLPLINISSTPGPASITPVPPSPTLTVSPSSPGPTGDISPSPTLNATQVATPSIIPDTPQNSPAVSPTVKPTPGLESLMAIVCMAGAALICKEKRKK